MDSNKLKVMYGKLAFILAGITQFVMAFGLVFILILDNNKRVMILFENKLLDAVLFLGITYSIFSLFYYIYETTTTEN